MPNQTDIDLTIILEENKLISNIMSAAKIDSAGDWKGSLCKLKLAEDAFKNIGVLETKCDINIDDFVNENTGSIICDIDNDKGIGQWAIKPSARGCNVFKIRAGQLPPPYGEFTSNEFVTNEFTEEVTS